MLFVPSSSLLTTGEREPMSAELAKKETEEKEGVRLFFVLMSVPVIETDSCDTTGVVEAISLVAVVKLKLLIAGSYRTYEEWKPLTTVVIGLSTASSYRTYEEWKHQWAEGERLTKISSYRTYEEWKQELGINADEYEFLVLTVPMRNGNLARSSQVPLPVPFLPYL